MVVHSERPKNVGRSVSWCHDPQPPVNLFASFSCGEMCRNKGNEHLPSDELHGNLWNTNLFEKELLSSPGSLSTFHVRGFILMLDIARPLGLGSISPDGPDWANAFHPFCQITWHALGSWHDFAQTKIIRFGVFGVSTHLSPK